MPRSSFEWETFAISNSHEIQGFDKKANNNFQKHLLFTAALVATNYEINRLNPLISLLVMMLESLQQHIWAYPTEMHGVLVLKCMLV